jgi:hypothetical protein
MTDVQHKKINSQKLLAEKKRFENHWVTTAKCTTQDVFCILIPVSTV